MGLELHLMQLPGAEYLEVLFKFEDIILGLFFMK